MKRKQMLGTILDALMTVLLLLLMAQSLVGEMAHEYLGIGIFVLFTLHHIVNRRWSKNLLKGKYTPFRIWQTILVVLVYITMLGSMVSGIVLSKYAFAFLPITEGSSWARTLHMLCAYWGFVFMSLHIGLHWGAMIGRMKKAFKTTSIARAWVVRLTGWLIAGYGVFAFIKRDIGSYMFLKIQFVFFDYDEPLIFFLFDYIAVMGLFTLIGHYISEGIKRIGRKKS